ncbi:MAG: carboxylesterase/lipase family protein [Lachnospiraceae bacterium]|nr:carboxylesterase/lipase family protein [Lachnospiraceae bacterium]
MQTIVNTKYGRIKGYERREMVEFLGIPYAKPPIGELRFKRAVECDCWDDVFDAKEYGSKSMQLENGQVVGSEDCLTLNIQRPLEGDKLPVLVWIHGGGYNTGAASDSLTDGLPFVEDGICYVSIQYRLNVLGFYDFSTYPGCEDFDSNCGLSDQIMALKWIHENIEYFGGNPEDVTIMGESAGAATVTNMLAVPSVKGYFQKAISESSLPNCVMTHEMAQENINLFMEGMGMTVADLPKLKTMNPEEFQKGNSYVAMMHQYKNPGMFLPGPIQDDLLPKRPMDAIKAGSAKDVKLLIGTNLNEGNMFVHPENTGFPNSWEMVKEMFEKNNNSDGKADIKKYYEKFGEDCFNKFATDYAFEMPAVKLAIHQSKYNDVYMYKFQYVTKMGRESGMGACHAFELSLVFKDEDFEFTKVVYGDEDKSDVNKIADQMHSDWVRFIKTGNPDRDNWNVFTAPNADVRIYDIDTKTEKLDRQELLAVWKDMRFYED